MKVIKVDQKVSASQLKTFLDERLNEAFNQNRDISLAFKIVEYDDQIEILNEENYDGFLMRIAVNGNNLNITKSEHYVDDVNLLSLEELLLNNLLLNFPNADSGVVVQTLP